MNDYNSKIKAIVDGITPDIQILAIFPRCLKVTSPHGVLRQTNKKQIDKNWFNTKIYGNIISTTIA